MNKAELAHRVSTSTGLNKAIAARVVEAVLDKITDALRAGDEVTVRGFGVFSVTERPIRTGRNPQTGLEIVIPAGRKPRFKAGDDLKSAVNGVVPDQGDLFR